MTWNYRIIQHTHQSGEIDLTIHEVYYDDGKIKNWSAEPIYAIGNNVSELFSDVHHMLAATTKPILKEVDDKLVEVEI